MNKISENIKQNKLNQWISDTFHLSSNTVVSISEHRNSHDKSASSHTEITIEAATGGNKQFIIKKSIGEITEQDIQKLQRFARFERLKKLPIIGNLFRFMGLWAAFTGMYAMFSVCPFCGQVGCPIGAGSAGLVGGFFALAVNNGKQFIRNINFLEIKKIFCYIFSKKRKI